MIGRVIKDNTMITNICDWMETITKIIINYKSDDKYYDNDIEDIIHEDIARIKLIREYSDDLKYFRLLTIHTDSSKPVAYINIIKINSIIENGNQTIHPEVFLNVDINGDININIYIPNNIFEANDCTIINALYTFYDITLKLANLDLYKTTIIESRLLDEMVFDNGEVVNSYDIKLLLTCLITTRIIVKQIGFENVDEAMNIFLKDIGYDENTVDIFIAKLFENIDSDIDTGMKNPEELVHGSILKMLS